jgi:AcrR family transcriptional regulator
MPRLWSDTIEAHRHDVSDAILSTTAALVAKRGLLAVTMSEVAEAAGIGRATLYKYFGDIKEILVAWHERQIAGHLHRLAQVRDQATSGERLQAVLHAYAEIIRESHSHGDREVVAFLHGDHRLERAQRRLHHLVRELILDEAGSREIREDVSADELASYCIHAIGGARSLPTPAAVSRLVIVTLAGLRPDSLSRFPQTTRNRRATPRGHAR